MENGSQRYKHDRLSMENYTNGGSDAEKNYASTNDTKSYLNNKTEVNTLNVDSIDI